MQINDPFGFMERKRMVKKLAGWRVKIPENVFHTHDRSFRPFLNSELDYLETERIYLVQGRSSSHKGENERENGARAERMVGFHYFFVDERDRLVG